MSVVFSFGAVLDVFSPPPLILVAVSESFVVVVFAHVGRSTTQIHEPAAGSEKHTCFQDQCRTTEELGPKRLSK